jgi:Ca-activated chloride channel homolog
MHRIIKSGVAAVFALISAHTAVMAADPQIKLRAEPSQSVLLEDEDGRTYLRVSLDGTPYTEEGVRTPVNVALVIDKSGSMLGPKVEHAKQAAIMALNRLTKSDMVSVIAFNHRIERLVPAGPYENADEMRRRIESIRADGQTAIFAAVSQGAQEIREYTTPERFSRVILLSDGQANVGPSSPPELERLGRELGGQGISVTTLGLGLDYNEDLMVRLASASDGSHAFVEDPEQLVDIFNKEFGDILSVVGQDVEIDIECPEGIRPMRALGREAKVSGQRISLKLNQVYGAQQKYVLIELDVPKNKARSSTELAKVNASYVDPRTKQRQSLSGSAQVQFSASKDEVKRSINAEVLGSVTRQIATERNEKAVKLRDEGKVEEAKRELKSNAEYLKQQADTLGAAPAAAPLRALSQKNEQDAGSVSGGEWNKTRKVMRYRQYQDKTQQKY